MQCFKSNNGDVRFLLQEINFKINQFPRLIVYLWNNKHFTIKRKQKKEETEVQIIKGHTKGGATLQSDHEKTIQTQ